MTNKFVSNSFFNFIGAATSAIPNLISQHDGLDQAPPYWLTVFS